MVLMSGKARNNASRSNQTTHFGIMGGLGPSVGSGQQFMLRRARNIQRIPPGAVEGKEYMIDHDILSKNPAGSGKIGRSALLVQRVQGPCNCLGAPSTLGYANSLSASAGLAASAGAPSTLGGTDSLSASAVAPCQARLPGCHTTTDPADPTYQASETICQKRGGYFCESDGDKICKYGFGRPCSICDIVSGNPNKPQCTCMGGLRCERSPAQPVCMNPKTCCQAGDPPTPGGCCTPPQVCSNGYCMAPVCTAGNGAPCKTDATKDRDPANCCVAGATCISTDPGKGGICVAPKAGIQSCGARCSYGVKNDKNVMCEGEYGGGDKCKCKSDCRGGYDCCAKQ